MEGVVNIEWHGQDYLHFKWHVVCSGLTTPAMDGVDPGGPVVIILTTGSEVRGFKPGRGRWIFSERKNPQYDLLRKGSKAVGPVS